MIRTIVILGALLAPLLFPWPLVVLLALIAAFFSPLAPLAVGLFADSLYYAHGAAILPWATLLGGVLALGSLFVRQFLETSIMR